MLKRGWMVVAAVALAGPASASQCFVDEPHSLRSEFAGADLVVLGVPQSDADYDVAPFLEVEVERTFKGAPVRSVTVVAWCGSCERPCYRAGVKVLLFLRRDDGETWSPSPRYQLRTVAPHPVVSRGDREVVVVAAGSLPLSELERLAREHAYADHEPPLTFRVNSDCWRRLPMTRAE